TDSAAFSRSRFGPSVGRMVRSATGHRLLEVAAFVIPALGMGSEQFLSRSLSGDPRENATRTLHTEIHVVEGQGCPVKPAPVPRPAGQPASRPPLTEPLGQSPELLCFEHREAASQTLADAVLPVCAPPFAGLREV